MFSEMLALPPALSVTFCEYDEVADTNPLCPEVLDFVEEVLDDVVVEDTMLLPVIVEEVELPKPVAEEDDEVVVVIC